MKLLAYGFRMAADQDYARAENALGSLYYRGLGVPLDANLAVTLFRKAASKVGNHLISFERSNVYDVGKSSRSKQFGYLL